MSDVVRSFTAVNLIQLPTLSTAAAIALGTEVVTAAKAQDLPPALKKPFGRVSSSLTKLRHAATQRLPAGEEDGSPPGAREADQDLDAAWACTHDWLQARAAMPLPMNEDSAKIARMLLATLFPTGLRFTTLAYKLEWAESQTRIARIDHDGLAASFEELGGGDFLKTIRHAHKAYGKVLGLTKLKEAAPPVTSLREPLDAFVVALRSYIVKVVANVEPDDAGSAELADALLEPIASWKSPARAVAEPTEAKAPDPKAAAGQPAASGGTTPATPEPAPPTDAPAAPPTA